MGVRRNKGEVALEVFMTAIMLFTVLQPAAMFVEIATGSLLAVALYLTLGALALLYKGDIKQVLVDVPSAGDIKFGIVIILTCFAFQQILSHIKSIFPWM